MAAASSPVRLLPPHQAVEQGRLRQEELPPPHHLRQDEAMVGARHGQGAADTRAVEQLSGSNALWVLRKDK